MNCKVVIFALVIFWSGISFSQENYVNEEVNSITSPKHAFGVHMGAVTGLGFSYRYFGDKFGFQLAGIPIFMGSGNYFYSVGGSSLFKLKSSRRIDIISYVGLHYINSNFNNNNSWLSIGLGGGVNIHTWIDVLDLSIQGGYGVYNISNDIISLPTGEIGFYYRF
jgi:hypothetical protein